MKKENKNNIFQGDSPAATVWWKKRRVKIVAGVIAVCFVILTSIWFFFYHPYVSTDDARVDADIIRIANQGSSQIIKKVYVEEGSRVSKGDLLVELDHQILEAQFNRAKARANLAGAELNRSRFLAAQNGISQQQFDLKISENQITSSELRLAEISLENTYLRSPLNGIVVQKIARPGNILETNQTAVTIVDIDRAWVSANIEETDVALVKPGQKVTITIDEGGTLTGEVHEIRKATASQFALIPADNAQGNFIKLVQRIPVKIILDPHPGRDLRVGQSVIIKIRVR